MQTTEELISLSDPGEVGRAEHNKGDRFVVYVANIFAWLFPILMIAICSQVILRGAGHNQAWLDDFQWWLYGAAVLVGIGYAVTTNSHVRVDIFYDNFGEAKKNRIEVISLVWLFLPFIILCWDVTVHYAYASVVADEGSDSPNGLHNLWILKVLMNASFVFIAIAVWSAYVRFLSKLMRPTLFRQLLWAFPSTMFAINLISYYAIWWFHFLTKGPDDTARDVSRSPIFDEFEFGAYDIKYTIVITLVLTILVLIIARLFEPRQASEG
jgi:TRAP-type mannitol/chloroaromatic compound transport system permease small subunit